MVCFIFPGKNFIVLLFVSLVLLFCCHVSCILVNVTRKDMDIFSYSNTGTVQCYTFCNRKQSSFLNEAGNLCICQCQSDYHTFVIAKLKCVTGKKIRNTSK